MTMTVRVICINAQNMLYITVGKCYDGVLCGNYFIVKSDSGRDYEYHKGLFITIMEHRQNKLSQLL
jgi:hypothetical protein